ncbi:MAG: FadR/GntR family transcriptional regulator [Phoenicibacter congonensis]|uniref:FadR/GntR family transcriptional regulator n=1 Tax=Phoenicibacter congonensis TaxID=1944646 RepID=A0AA43U6J9_9ACTN|nr:FadR/GntR family transcriptional regulator [Phoenicibacter congonensis]
MADGKGNSQKKYKYHQVSEAIIENIAAGKWKPGEKIPPEAELCQSFNVSRVTLRESLKALSILGILNIVQGDGTYVQQIDPVAFIQPLLPLLRCDRAYIDEIYEARMVVESGCCQLSAKSRTQADLDEIKALIEDMQNAIDLGQYDLFNEADAKFHRVIINSCGNELLSAVGNLFFTLVTYFIGEINITPSVIAKSLGDHIKIYEAICDQRTEFARITMSEHLRSSMLVLKKHRQQE